ncbi:MAG: hypothetical protein AB7I98_03960 [Verrucomicrobiales bacterium]
MIALPVISWLMPTHADKPQRGGQPGNTNAAKPEERKIYGKGRANIDLGPLKAAAITAASKRRMKLADWMREAVEEKLVREAKK